MASPKQRRLGVLAAVAALLASLLPVLPGQTAHAATLPSGFTESTAFSGLTNPTVVRFSPDGRVFVAEKSGLIKVFDDLNDTTASVFADLRTQVHNYWDRGLLGFVLDPNFPATPDAYVLYARDAPVAGTAPRWGTAGTTSDPCPTPPGPTSDGCVISGRLSRLTATGNSAGPEQVLIDDWCQQYPSHSVGSLQFGADGALYASAGDGASFDFADYGQDGAPLNPCGDPPGGVGATLTPPTAEGGALRSQDLRSSADPTTLDGSVIRIDKQTGLGLSTNPLASSSDANNRRIVAHGLRNPFRFGFRPGTNELWIADVGWGTYEEINRIVSPVAPTVANFGWPCYEGAPRQSGYDSANLNLCESLYTAGAGAVVAPYYAYHHSDKVVSGESCSTGSSSISGIAFYQGGSYPASYNDGLFFSDYSRDCIWFMAKGSNGLPDPAQRATFVAQAANPVNLEIGPGGDLFYVDFDGGTIRRVTANVPPPPSGVFLSDLQPTTAINGWGPYERDRSNGEAAAGDGNIMTLAGVSYSKGLGVHAVSDLRYTVPSTCSTFVADIGLDDEVGSFGSATFTVYVGGTAVYTSPTLTGASATIPLSIPVTPGVELRLVVGEGAGGLSYDHGDWANARFTCGTDSTPPVVSQTAPTAGATGVAAATVVRATFNEPMLSSSISTSSFTLRQGASTPVTGTVTYDGATRVASFTPTQALQAAATYTATVKGGSAGVTDVAGNPMAADVVWSFTVATTTPPPTGTTYLSSLTPTTAINGWGPYERDMSNGEQAAGDGVGLKLNGTTYAKGLGVHAASDLRYTVPTGCTRFLAHIGLDDEVGSNGSVVFRVLVGGATVYTSATLTGASATVPLDLAVSAGSELRLVVDVSTNGASYDHADWADARLACAGGGANQPPSPVIASPASSVTWSVGQNITFSGSATDPEDGTLAASRLTWELLIQHCPSNCHAHSIQTYPGVAGGSFSAPDHEYPSHLELRLTAQDSAGATASTSVLLNPKTVTLGFATSPTGLELVVNGVAATAPFNRTVIVGSSNSISAPTPQTSGAGTHTFSTWSDSGAATHNIVAPATAATYTATYTTTPPPTGTTYLSSLTPTTAINGWGPYERDMSNGEQAAGDGVGLKLNGTTYAKGLGVHAASDLRYTVPTGCTRFLAHIGLDDEVGSNGSVVFRVLVGGATVYTSATLTGASATVPLDLAVSAGSELRLVVDVSTNGASYDHADWADARLACGP